MPSINTWSCYSVSLEADGTVCSGSEICYLPCFTSSAHLAAIPACRRSTCRRKRKGYRVLTTAGRRSQRVQVRNALVTNGALCDGSSLSLLLLRVTAVSVRVSYAPRPSLPDGLGLGGNDTGGAPFVHERDVVTSLGQRLN